MNAPQGMALAAPPQHGVAAPPAGTYDIGPLKQMAAAVVASRLFPNITSEASALTLMLLCQAEGLHPIQAMRRFHIIQGQVSLRTDAMLADFQNRGGKIKWIELGYERCEAEFHSPGLVEPVRYFYTMEDAKRAKLAGRDSWLKDPRSMLKARVISGGLRIADPGAVVGLYADKEVEDFEPRKAAEEVRVIDVEAEPVSTWREPTDPTPLGPDGEDTTTGEILERAAENREALYVPKSPTACAHCKGPIGRFVSTSKRYEGRAYFQCQAAQDLRAALLEEGVPNKGANQQIDAHYREWAEPWPPKKEKPQ